jgi:rfaE bifunctional protein nucleotidyltransferase chain/domain
MNEPTSRAAGSSHHKVRTLDALALIAQTERDRGRRVVLCHGVFDLVHLGHVRHLELARQEGDVLIVTLTADAFVNKGPGRPIFSEAMRAEMMAALGHVDWVGINYDPSAEAVLAAVKPDIYVKGSDYENPEDDITGKIRLEQEAVERHGGRLVFTRDITFSSSNLINRYLNVYDPPLRDFLDKVRDRHSIDDVVAMVESVRKFRVLLVGEAIIDEYQYVEALGKSAKEHMIATRSTGSEIFSGGVIAAANHVAGLCDHVEVITILGEENSFEPAIRGNLKPNVALHPIVVPGRPTTRKTRFVDTGYMRKMFEVYSMDDRPVDRTSEDRMIALIRARAAEADLVIVTDFGHGMIGARVIDALLASAKFLALNVQTNSGNQGYNLVTKYPRADYVCIDAPEARLALADKYSDIATIVGQTLPDRMNCQRLVVTHGAHGCYTFDRKGGLERIPAFTKTVVDTVGAGDAFLAVTAPLAAAGLPMEVVGLVGNAAGAIKVGIVGHRASVEKVPLLKFVTTLLK